MISVTAWGDKMNELKLWEVKPQTNPLRCGARLLLHVRLQVLDIAFQG
jgi:hypothetical protein